MKKFISVILATLLVAALAVPAFATAPTDACPAYGNVDTDDTVTVSDARLVLRNAIGLDEFTDEQKTKADLDGNGVSVSDARLVLRIAIKLDNAPKHPITADVDTTTAQNEYAILNTTKYAVVGTMKDASGSVVPMTLARNGNKMYMSSTMDLMGDGSTVVTVGVLVIDGKLYMVTDDHKYSLEFTDKVAEAFGMSKADIAEMTDISNFQIDAPDLSLAASVEKATVTCPVCGESFETGSVYIFNYDDGTTGKVYMNGNKLIKIESYSKYNRLTAVTEFTSVTANPSDTYFALPSSKLNRYPTALQTPTAAMLAFMGKIIDIKDLI